MPKSHYKFQTLAQKNLHVQAQLYQSEEWGQLCRVRPGTPQSYHDLQTLGEQLFNKQAREDMMQPLLGGPGVGTASQPHGTGEPFATRPTEECGESLYQAFYDGIGNPSLSETERTELELMVDADTPGFDRRLESEHFVLRWSTDSIDPDNNIPDSAIVHETKEHLETAWSRLNTSFERPPMVPAGREKIEVVFQDMAGYGAASPPEGPIQLNAKMWVERPGIRKPTSAHELFHKLQYAYGYRTRWTPASPYKWFSEGCASWAEAHVWGRVSRASKLQELYAQPDTALFDSSYAALPFWLFYDEQRRAPGATHSALSALFAACDDRGGVREALGQELADGTSPMGVPAAINGFFASFARDRLLESGGASSRDIVGPDDSLILPHLATREIPFGGEGKQASVAELGTDYYRARLPEETDGLNIAIALEMLDAGVAVCTLFELKDGVLVSEHSRVTVPPRFSLTLPVDRAHANELYLAISGIRPSNRYRVSLSVL